MVKYLTFLLLCFTPALLCAQETQPGDIQLLEVPNAETAVYSISDTAEPGISQNESRYLFMAGVDLLAGGDYSSTSPRFYMVHGHRFTPQLSAGFGIGYTPYNDPFSLIPFFIDLNYRFSEQSTSAFLNLKAGYNFTTRVDDDLLLDVHKGGLIFNPAVGVEFRLGRSAGFQLSAGYNIDNSSYQYESWGNRTVVNRLSFRRLSLGAGIVF